MKALLLSGGIDSAALAYWKEPNIVYNINYGQRSAIAERIASTAIAKALRLKIRFIDIDCSSLGSGDLTDKRKLKIAPVSEWWPFRNQLLITFACMNAINDGVQELMVGAVNTDNKHKDGSSIFYERINNLIKFQEGRIRVTAPAIHLSSLELIRKGKIPNSILGWTHSCHTSNYPCGKCNGCLKHLYIKESIVPEKR